MTHVDVERAKHRSEGERRPHRWIRRIVVASCVTLIASLFSHSQSDVAFANRLKQSNGMLRFSHTGPAWIRDSLPITVSDALAVWFDTPTEFYVGKDASIETLDRAAQIESLRGLAFDHRDIDERHVAVFRGHPSITNVRLSNTQVTDAVFPILESFPRLAFVSLSATEVTPAGLDAFRERRPSVEIQIDPVTASGLRLVSNGRATFDGERTSANTLTLRGSLDAELLAAVRRLPVRRLVLEGVEAGAELADVVGDQSIEALFIHGGRVDVSFAEAVVNNHLTTIELADVALTQAVTEALSAAPNQFVELARVTLEENALSGLVRHKQLTGIALRQLTLAESDSLETATIEHLSLEEVRISPGARPLNGAAIHSLSLDRIDAESALLPSLVGVPTRGLGLFSPRLSDSLDHTWPSAVRAERNVILDGIDMTSDEATAIAAMPIDLLSLSDIRWLGDAAGSFKDVKAKTLLFDRLPVQLAPEFWSSDIEELIVREDVPGAELTNVGHLTRLRRLDLHVESATAPQLAAAVDVPSLEIVTLRLSSPAAVPVNVWQRLSASHPGLRLSVFHDAKTSYGVQSRRLWPQ